MNICFFNAAKIWGGGEKWHFDAATACHKHGHSVTVASSINSELIQRVAQNGIKTKGFRLSTISALNPWRVHAIYSFFKQEQFDVIIFNFSKDLKNAAYAAKKAGIKHIIYRRGSDIPIKNSLHNRIIFGKLLTNIIANSEATKKTILQNNPNLFPKDKIKVIYNGIHLNNFLAKEKQSNPIPVIGNLGRCVYQKGQENLLEIAHILKSRGINFRLVIGGDGILLEQLKEKAEQLNISDITTFSGFVSDPANFMNSIDIFALTSHWEGFGYVLAEAMACQNALVAYNISSNPELVFHKKNGLLIPYADKEAFADALAELIQNEAIRKEFGSAGLQLANEQFNLEQNIAKFISFIEELHQK